MNESFVGAQRTDGRSVLKHDHSYLTAGHGSISLIDLPFLDGKPTKWFSSYTFDLISTRGRRATPTRYKTDRFHLRFVEH